jgi:hypothetical protein
MPPASIDLLKIGISQMLKHLDFIPPGEEDIELEMHNLKDHVHYMVLTCQEFKEYASIAETSLLKIEGMIDEKIRNPYFECRDF